MSDQLWFWAALGGLAVLALLGLPVATVSKLILQLTALALRLTLLGVVAAGAYLGFQPGDLPAGVAAVLDDFPRLLAYLPDRTSPLFGPTLALILGGIFLPVLAVLDVARKLAGRRLRRLRELADAPAVPVSVEPAPVVVAAVPEAVPALRPVDRRTAATTLTTAGTRSRPANVR